MAGCEESNLDFVYDPVRLSPEGSLFNRIDLEKRWDQSNGPAYNPESQGFFSRNPK